jgi:hypothetical protein
LKIFEQKSLREKESKAAELWSCVQQQALEDFKIIMRIPHITQGDDDDDGFLQSSLLLEHC